MNVSFLNLLRIPEIRQKIMFTLGFLMIYRIGFQIPLPGVNYKAFKDAAAQVGGGGLPFFFCQGDARAYFGDFGKDSAGFFGERGELLGLAEMYFLVQDSLGQRIGLRDDERAVR